mmetsp:Transcript_7725/g.28488  ORF Transcript_7725/g.28488 Transcript_7725/m.28488 type:complete len:213 (+) Transcript_7725:2942-3580(+)
MKQFFPGLLEYNSTMSAGMASSSSTLTKSPTRTCCHCFTSKLPSGCITDAISVSFNSMSSLCLFMSSTASFTALMVMMKMMAIVVPRGSYGDTSSHQLRPATMRKYTFTAFRSCSNKFLGRNVNRVYLDVFTLLLMKWSPTSGSLSWISLNSFSSFFFPKNMAHLSLRPMCVSTFAFSTTSSAPKRCATFCHVARTIAGSAVARDVCSRRAG